MVCILTVCIPMVRIPMVWIPMVWIPMVCIPIFSTFSTYFFDEFFQQIFSTNFFDFFDFFDEFLFFAQIFFDHHLLRFFRRNFRNFSNKFFWLILIFSTNFLSFNHCELLDRSTFDLVLIIKIRVIFMVKYFLKVEIFWGHEVLELYFKCSNN